MRATEVTLSADIPSSAIGSVEQCRINAKEAFLRGDFVTAKDLYYQLADMGDKVAMLSLGNMYGRGCDPGVPKDAVVARYWYERAFNEASSSVAAIALGRIYYRGEGVSVDYKKALFYFSKLDKDRYPLGLLYLGIMFEKGNGVTQDIVKARSYYRRAARGNVFALKNWAVLEVKRGNPLGFLLWGFSFLQTWWLLTFKRGDERLRMS